MSSRNTLPAVGVGTVLMCVLVHGEQVRIGSEAVVPENARSHYSRYVNWRPADGELLGLNPPRMSWPYWPDWPNNWKDESHTFRLQISSKQDCSQPVVDVSCPFNFYNTLPALKGAERWFWRVGYDVGTKQEKWSAPRAFAIANDAVKWDRSALAKPPLAERGHPRILFNKDNLRAVRALAKANPDSKAMLDNMQRQADAIMRKGWWKRFPETDRGREPKQPFYTIARDLAMVCFVWRMTEDDKYAGVKDRAVTWASYPPGGRASPEGLGGDGSEDATQGNEFLALLFDWLYADLSGAERAVMIKSLEWRIDHIMNRFAWRYDRGARGPMVRLTFQGRSMRDNPRRDQRLRLRRSAEWRGFEWSVIVPQRAEGVMVESFNYYAAGEVWWDSVHVRIGSNGKELLINPDFSQVDSGRPVGWRAHKYKTKSELRFEPKGGYKRTGAAAIICDDSTERGSWGQGVRLKGVKELRVTGRYRTAGGMSGTPVRAHSLSGCCSSHQYEASMDTAVCGLALYEHSEIGREWFDLILNYLIGITCGYGFDEAWNEGAGYGTSKAKWLMNATMYLDTALPEASLGRNPFYLRIGDWFSRIIPVGMDHHAWGNQRNSSRWNHLAHFRKLAYLTGEGRFLLNWQQYGGKGSSKWRPWIEYVLPAYYDKPTPEPETDPVKVFDIAGWAMAATGPPSLRSTYEKGAGVIFQCRPRGGYSHSFNSDASFQLHAYGQMLNHGGGSSANKDAYAYHTMSHNTILVDGLGQAQPTRGMLYPTYGRIVGFKRGPDYVYFAGDATRCYPKRPGSYRRWSLPLHEVYERRALPHLERFIRHILFLRGRYFVIYDDLASSKPATYTWLYHIQPKRPFSFDKSKFAVDYAVGKVKVRLQHIAYPHRLKLDNRKGLDAFVNPFTGEDYRKWRQGEILCAHNLWVSNAEPAKEWRFLTVVYPASPGSTIPPIERIDDATVRIGEDVVCFDPKSATAARANFIVDVAATR